MFAEDRSFHRFHLGLQFVRSSFSSGSSDSIVLLVPAVNSCWLLPRFVRTAGFISTSSSIIRFLQLWFNCRAVSSTGLLLRSSEVEPLFYDLFVLRAKNILLAE